MDYYQGVVIEYLRANRTVFVNTECCIQLNAAENPDSSGPHWFCDAVAVDFEKRSIFLCEVSYAKTLGGLLKRLTEWNLHWDGIKTALIRDCRLPQDFQFLPWLFIPKHSAHAAESGLERIRKSDGPPALLPYPRITFLEDVAPWKYRCWNRRDTEDSPEPGELTESV